MLRVTLEINQREIGKLGIVNTGVTDDDGRHHYDVWDLREDPAEKLAEVTHDRSERAAALAEKVMADVGEEFLEDET